MAVKYKLTITIKVVNQETQHTACSHIIKEINFDKAIVQELKREHKINALNEIGVRAAEELETEIPKVFHKITQHDEAMIENAKKKAEKEARKELCNKQIQIKSS
jgi:actin-like ATPase involved in cell morphogenesis